MVDQDLNPDQSAESTDEIVKKQSPSPSRSIVRKIVRGIIIFTMIPYLVLFGLLFISQRSLIYPGSVSGSNKISKAGFPEGQTHELKLKTEDHLELNGWLVLPKGEKANDLQQAIEFTKNNCNLVLFFPGNAENRQLRVGGILDFTQLGFAVLIVDYRGYADNPGNPSQKWMTKDAIALWDLLTQEYLISNDKIFIFGESLGGAVAVQLVSDICQKKKSIR